MTQASVLVVEDEAHIAIDLQDQLEGFGYRVLANVPTGPAALQALDHGTPDVVLMDIHLAGPLDGIQTAMKLRERCTSPVVFLTAHGDPDTLGRAQALPPAGYLIKPFDTATLRATLHMAVAAGRYAAEREARQDLLVGTLDLVSAPILRIDAERVVRLVNRAARDRGVRVAQPVAQALEQLGLGPWASALDDHLDGLAVELPQRLGVHPHPEGAMLTLEAGFDDDVVCVCAWCHQARGQRGWTQLGEVLSEDHGLRVSHGLCDRCARSQFGDLTG